MLAVSEGADCPRLELRIRRRLLCSTEPRIKRKPVIFNFATSGILQKMIIFLGAVKSSRLQLELRTGNCEFVTTAIITMGLAW